MNSQLVDWSDFTTSTESNSLDAVSNLNRVINLAGCVFIATFPVLAIVVGAAWSITVPAAAMVIHASLWALGFLFLAIATEWKGRELSGWALSTGIALPLLAFLGSYLAGEFTVIAAAILGAWVAFLIISRLWDR